jgi:hypothetical protein
VFGNLGAQRIDIPAGRAAGLAELLDKPSTNALAQGDRPLTRRASAL